MQQTLQKLDTTTLAHIHTNTHAHLHTHTHTHTHTPHLHTHSMQPTNLLIRPSQDCTWLVWQSIQVRSPLCHARRDVQGGGLAH